MPAVQLMLDVFRSDLKYSLRLLQKKPGFAAVVVAILALGIGINSAVFSLVNGVLLKPLPVENPEQLVRLYKTAEGTSSSQMSYADYQDYRNLDPVFSGMAAISMVPMSMRIAEQNVQRQILTEVVSFNYFPVLGIPVSPGRSFAINDQRVAVVSPNFWERQFNGESFSPGRNLVLNGESYEIIGLTPEKFRGTYAGARIDAWVPLESAAGMLGMDWRTNRDRAAFHTIARLKPSVSREQAKSEIDRLSNELERMYPESNRGEGIRIVEATYLHGSLRKAASAFLAAVMVLVGFVLLIACFNVANLLLVRGLGRSREMAIRCSLGANRFRLLRQLITESMLMTGLGGLVGVILAYWVADLLTGWNPIPFVPFELDLRPDFRVFGFAFIASLLTGLLVGILPGIRATRQDVSPLLKESGSALSGSKWHSRFRDLLVIAQLAVCLVLLIQVALFSQSLKNSINSDPGFDSSRMFATDIDVDSQGLNEEQGRLFYESLMDSLASEPEIESATLADRSAPDISTPFVQVAVDGQSSAEGNPWIRVSSARVYFNYFEAMKIPVSGRSFTRNDNEKAPLVAIINQNMAGRFWPRENPIGKRFRLQGSPDRVIEIIGVAKDSKYRSLGEDPTPHIYLPYLQNYVPSMALLVRGRIEPGSLTPRVQQIIQSIHPQMQGFFTRTLKEHIGFSLLPAKLAAALTGGFGTVALWIALIGIYGAVSFLVSSRSREIGIRVAMGASGKSIFGLILQRGLFYTGLGLAAGAVLTLAVNRLVSGFLFGISPYDPLTWILVCFLLGLVTLAACSIPARRAARLNPVSALRYE